MGNLYVSLLGKLRVNCDHHMSVDFDSIKVQELFCYLLLNRDHSHPRETLASVLWGDNDTARSKKYLRQTLWQLQTALDLPCHDAHRRVLLIESDWVRIATDNSLWLDISVFEQAMAMVRGIAGRRLDGTQARVLQDAIELYHGDLLEGWYQDWCLYERERLQNIYLAMLDKMMEYCEAHQAYEAGLDYGSRILRHDRARERTHLRMMRLYYLSDDRTAALRQYEICAAALREELGVRPADRTARLYEQIRTNQADFVSQAPGETDIEPEPAVTNLLDLVCHLRQILTTLAGIHQQVQQDILAIERKLNGPD